MRFHIACAADNRIPGPHESEDHRRIAEDDAHVSDRVDEGNRDEHQRGENDAGEDSVLQDYLLHSGSVR